MEWTERLLSLWTDVVLGERGEMCILGYS